MNGPVAWLPYCGIAPQPAELLSRWNLDPLLLAGLGLAGYAALRLTSAARPRERHAALAALAVALLLFVSPFCALTSALFAARSAHHVLLTALVAPLIAAALPRPALHHLPGNLAVGTGIAALTLWLWHAPAAYAAALSSDAVYWLMQASLLGTALAFWMSVRRTAAGPAIIALLVYMVQMGLLGALLTFAPQAFYAPHALTTAAWGLSPLEDQQLGGIIMWVPGAAAYMAAALFLLYRMLERPQRPAAA